MKKIVILILIIFSIINCQSDDDKLNDNKAPSNDAILKTFNLKLDKSYFLVNKEIKLKVNYELENKQDNKNLVLRLKSIGEDALKHQIKGVDFIFGKNDVKEKQEFFDNIDGHLYLTPKRTGYLDLEFSGQLYDTVKKEYVGEPIISKISMVSLKIDLSLSYATSYTNIDVKFDDGIYETDNFLSTENKIVQGFDLTVIVDDNELKTTKNINLYEITKIFNSTKGSVPKKIDIILEQRLTNGKINTFKFNDLEFKFKEVTLKTFDLKLDKNYFLVNKEIKVNVNYELENKQDNKNLVLRLKSIGKDAFKHQINGVDFIFGKNDVKEKQDFFDNIDGHLYLTPKRTGSLDLEFSGQLYDTVKKEYVGKPIISKISMVSLKIDLSLSYATSYTNIDVKFDDGIYETDNFLSTENKIVQGFDLTVIVDDNELKTTKNINLYEITKIFKNKTSNVPKKLDIVLKQRLTNGSVNIFKFNNLKFNLKDVTLSAFDLKLDKKYFLSNKKIKIKVNYEVGNKGVNKNLVLRIRSIGKNVLKHQINGVDFIFGENDFMQKKDFFDITDDYMYLKPKRAGYLDLEFSGQLYDTVKKEYVGKSVISKINFVSLKIDVLLEKTFRDPLTSFYKVIIKLSDGDFKNDNFLSKELGTVKGFDIILDINNDTVKVIDNINPYSKGFIGCRYRSGPIMGGGEGGHIYRIDIDLLKKMTNGKVSTLTFKNVKFRTIGK